MTSPTETATLESCVPVAVIIPTYARGLRVLETLRRVTSCTPRPSEIWVHVDCSDGTIEKKIGEAFPEVNLLNSSERLGPGGSRHRLLNACRSRYAASFDDDSYPVDTNFFAKAMELLESHPAIAVVGASIWHPHQAERPLRESRRQAASFPGGGHVIRVAAYKEVRGYLRHPVPYGLEETDLSLQLFAKQWGIIDSDELRVYHDNTLATHAQPSIVSASIANVAVYAFLNYPIRAWPYAVLQVGNAVWFSLRMRRFRGIVSGLLRIPLDCWRYRRHRRPVPFSVLMRYLRSRRSNAEGS